MQFYNSDIAKVLDSLTEKGFNLQLKIVEYTQTQINYSLSTGNIVSFADFVKNGLQIVEINVKNFEITVDELPKSLNEKNINELDAVMMTQGIEKVRIFPETEFPEEKKIEFRSVVNGIVKYYYDVYIRSYNEIQGSIRRATTNDS